MPSDAPPPDATRRHLAAEAALLDLDIKPEWMDAVAQFFEVAREMAAEVARSEAVGALEAAPVFTPWGPE